MLKNWTIGAALFLLTPILVSWFFLLLIPFLMVAALPLLGCWLGVTQWSFTKRKSLKTEVHALEFPIRSERSGLSGLLRAHLKEIPLPQNACACVVVTGGKLKLATRFVANAGAWSHVTEAANLHEAISRMKWKLRHDLPAGKSCGNHLCAHASVCPNLAPRNGALEIARVVA